MIRRTAVVLLALSLSIPTSARANAMVPVGRTGVGDSIMLSVKADLRTRGWHGIHAVVGRQFAEGVQVVGRLLAQGTLTKHVIVELGTNGPIDPADCDALVALAGPHRRVFLVTNKVPRWWQDPNNDTLKTCARTYPKVDVIRWWGHSHGHPRWFADDHYHLSTEGRGEFAAFLDESVDAIVAGSPRALR